MLLQKNRLVNINPGSPVVSYFATYCVLVCVRVHVFVFVQQHRSEYAGALAGVGWGGVGLITVSGEKTRIDSKFPNRRKTKLIFDLFSIFFDIEQVTDRSPFDLGLDLNQSWP